jgi:hypothetical protein
MIVNIDDGRYIEGVEARGIGESLPKISGNWEAAYISLISKFSTLR